MGTNIRQGRGGFSRIDLLVIMAAISFLAALTFPSMANSGKSSRSVACMSNHRQLIQGWLMYAEENNGKLVHNIQGGIAQGGSSASRFSAWAFGWLDWTTSRDNTNVQLMIDPRYGRLAGYVMKDPKVFKCPLDTYLSEGQARMRWKERARSYSMNIAMGQGNQLEGPFDPLQIFVKIEDIVAPPPSKAFVFIDEHPDSINDPMFFVSGSTRNGTGQWIDLPASYHSGGTVVSMADGHVELKRWQDPQTKVPVRLASSDGLNVVNSPDLQWLRDRTSAPPGN